MLIDTGLVDGAENHTNLKIREVAAKIEVREISLGRQLVQMVNPSQDTMPNGQKLVNAAVSTVGQDFAGTMQLPACRFYTVIILILATNEMSQMTNGTHI